MRLSVCATKPIDLRTSLRLIVGKRTLLVGSYCPFHILEALLLWHQMPMKQHIGLAALLLCSVLGQAQDLRLMLRGEQLTRPGMQAALEIPYGHPSSPVGYYWGPRLSTYYFPQNHLGLMPGIEQGMRYSHPNGFYAALAVHFSLYRSFYKGQTYRPQADGSFKKVPWGGTMGLGTRHRFALGLCRKQPLAFAHRGQLLPATSVQPQLPTWLGSRSGHSYHT